MSNSTEQGSTGSGAANLVASRRDWVLRAGILVTSLAVIACFAAAFTSADRDTQSGISTEIAD